MNKVNFKITADEPRGCGVYVIKHPSTGILYCGSTKDGHRRLLEHISELNRGKHYNTSLQEASFKDSEFQFEFRQTESVEMARQFEQRFIDSNIDNNSVVNVSPNTDNSINGLAKVPSVIEKFRQNMIGNTRALGLRHSDEWKQEASLRLTGNKHLLGHRHSDEAKKKMSDAKIGKPRPKETIAKSSAGRTRWNIVVGETIYFNAAQAAAALGISSSGVIKRCESPNFPNYKRIPKV